MDGQKGGGDYNIPFTFFFKKSVVINMENTKCIRLVGNKKAHLLYVWLYNVWIDFVASKSDVAACENTDAKQSAHQRNLISVLMENN